MDNKKYYLIDYENVHDKGLAGCENLDESDQIVIFYTKNANHIDMDKIADHGKAELKMIKVPAGNQSADIHIASYLGYLAGKYEGKACNVVIVSKDTDFDKLIKFWKDKIKVSRVPQIKAQSVSKQTSNQKVGKKVSGAKKTKLNQEVM